jgi:hypothetical protein
MAVKFIQFLCMVSVGLGLWSCGSNEEKVAGASEADLAADVAEINLHDIIQFQSKTHVFKIKNTGQQAVMVTGIEKSCGCTNVELAKDTLLPGEETDLTAALSAQDRVGGFVSHITVKWCQKGNREERQLKLSLHGKAVRLAVCEPVNLDFGEIDVDKSTAAITRQVLIRRGDAAVAWDDIEVTTDAGQQIQSTALNRDTFQIQYTLRPNKHPIGIFKDELTVRFKDQAAYLPNEIKIPVIAGIKSPLVVKPASVYLGSLAKNASKQGIIKISHSSGKPVKILSITSSAHIQCEAANETTGETTVSYRFDAKTQAGNVSEKLLVKVACENDRYELAIPFIGFVQ